MYLFGALQIKDDFLSQKANLSKKAVTGKNSANYDLIMSELN